MTTTYAVWKYPFELADSVEIEMPSGAKILHVGLQGGTPCIWARVEPDASQQLRRFCVIGTGRPFSELEASRHIATFQQPPFVWHLFEAREQP